MSKIAIFIGLVLGIGICILCYASCSIAHDADERDERLSRRYIASKGREDK